MILAVVERFRLRGRLGLVNGPLLKDAANAGDFEALVEFMYAQGDRADALAATDPKVVKGGEIFANGKLTSGEFDTACSGCHTMSVAADDNSESAGLFPVLTGYAGKDWLKKFISDPKSHYAGGGDDNAMPGFKDQLTEKELDLLVRWLTGDYYRAGK